MTHVLAVIENSPALLVSVLFFIGWTTTLWGLPALKALLKSSPKVQ
ncbi:MAG: hypothetical protein M3Q44_03780 [bacterium]|nr:hypothetical protein [bacterium]